MPLNFKEMKQKIANGDKDVQNEGILCDLMVWDFEKGMLHLVKKNGCHLSVDYWKDDLPEVFALFNRSDEWKYGGCQWDMSFYSIGNKNMTLTFAIHRNYVIDWRLKKAAEIDFNEGDYSADSEDYSAGEELK